MSALEPHLSNERIQGYLDRRLGPDAEAAVRTHLSGCAPCRKEVEAWQGLFSTLSEMREIAPSPAFSRKVMDTVELPRREGLLGKIAAILPSWVPGGSRSGRSRGGHLEPRIVLGHLDQALPARRERAVTTHVESCPSCRAELGRWRAVIGRIESLGHVSPGPGFADGVIARVRMRAETPDATSVGLPQRISEQLERLRPRSRRGWAVAGASTLAPVAAVAVATLTLFTSHPLLTPASLASFIWWQVTGAVRGMATILGEWVVASPLALEVWRALEGISDEPVMAGAGAVAFGLTTMAALWILYRNLTATPPADRGYANVSA